MTKQTKSKWLKQIMFVSATIFLFAAHLLTFAQEDVNGKYKVGERVECDANTGRESIKKEQLSKLLVRAINQLAAGIKWHSTMTPRL